jgi:ferredoxin like protein
MGANTLEDKLATVKFNIDKNPHIKVKLEICAECVKKPCTICPAGCYEMEDDKIVFNHEGCLECGTCREVCPSAAVEWAYPEKGRGVAYLFG